MLLQEIPPSDAMYSLERLCNGVVVSFAKLGLARVGPTGWKCGRWTHTSGGREGCWGSHLRSSAVQGTSSWSVAILELDFMQEKNLLVPVFLVN